jgi:hypothetical protein
VIGRRQFLSQLPGLLKIPQPKVDLPLLIIINKHHNLPRRIGEFARGYNSGIVPLFTKELDVHVNNWEHQAVRLKPFQLSKNPGSMLFKRIRFESQFNPVCLYGIIFEMMWKRTRMFYFMTTRNDKQQIGQFGIDFFLFQYNLKIVNGQLKVTKR